jgi:hypothetical protein
LSDTPSARDSPRPSETEEFASCVSLPGLEMDQTLLLLRALGAELFDPSVDIPKTPTLLVAGTEDDPVGDIAATLPNATYMTVPLVLAMRLRSEDGVARCVLVGGQLPLAVAPHDRPRGTNGLLARHLGLAGLEHPAKGQ